MPQRVLLISYAFPPKPGAGPLRPGRLAKLLPEYGWTPTTLTGPWKGGNADLGEVVAITPLGDPHAARIRGMDRIASSPTRWFPLALQKTFELTARRRFDAVISVSNPGYDHVLAAAVARRSGMPWIADYSEAWTGNMFAPQSPLVRRWSRFLETTSIREAAAITCATSGIRNMLTKLHGRTDIDVIENAVDLSEWEHVPNTPPKTFTILFAGMLWGGTLTPELLFGAVAKLRRAGHPAGAAARFAFYSDEHRIVAESARRHGLLDSVQLYPTTLRDRVLQAERQAAVLLILFPMRAISVVPSKLYEFYGARRPILAIGPEQTRAQLGELIEGNRLGHFSTTEEECAAAVCMLYDRFTSGWYETDPDPRWSPPTAQATTRRFAEILNRVTGAAPYVESRKLLIEEHA